MSSIVWPIKMKAYLHGGKFGEDEGYEEIANMFNMNVDDVYDEVGIKYLVHELELDVEIDQDSNIHITHINGQKLNTPIVNT